MYGNYIFFGTLSFQTMYRECMCLFSLIVIVVSFPSWTWLRVMHYNKSRLLLRAAVYGLFCLLLILLCHIHFFYNCCCHCLFSLFRLLLFLNYAQFDNFAETSPKTRTNCLHSVLFLFIFFWMKDDRKNIIFYSMLVESVEEQIISLLYVPNSLKSRK